MLIKVKTRVDIWTASPEKFWSAGEVKEVSETIALQLLSNPNFEKVVVAEEQKQQPIKKALKK